MVAAGILSFETRSKLYQKLWIFPCSFGNIHPQRLHARICAYLQIVLDSPRDLIPGLLQRPTTAGVEMFSVSTQSEGSSQIALVYSIMMNKIQPRETIMKPCFEALTTKTVPPIQVAQPFSSTSYGQSSGYRRRGSGRNIWTIRS